MAIMTAYFKIVLVVVGATLSKGRYHHHEHHQTIVIITRGLVLKKLFFCLGEKNCFSAWASTLNMGLINKVDMVCLSPVGYGV